MTDMIPLKYNSTGPKAGSLGEFDTNDSIPVIHGGTGKVSIAANKFLYSTTANVFAEADLTTAGRDFLALANTSTMREYLGLVIGTNAGQVITASVNGRLPILDGRNLSNTVPAGVICMWSGSIASIPANFRLCDGTNGTPDLRDKFIVGAGLSYVPGAVGGTTTHTHSVTVQNTTLTISQIPSHKHFIFKNGSTQGVGIYNPTSSSLGTVSNSYNGSWLSNYLIGESITPNAQADVGSSSSEGGDQPHTHGTTVSTSSNLPPYHALAYIMSVTI